jgi:hypothetical protein
MAERRGQFGNPEKEERSPLEDSLHAVVNCTECADP